MTRLLTTGFETGTFADVVANAYSSIETSTIRTGAYSLKCSGQNSYVRLRQFPTASSTIYTSMMLVKPFTGQNQAIIGFLDPAAGLLGTLRFTSSEQISFYVGTTLTATGTINIPSNQWFSLEVYFYITDSGGRLTTKVNGVQDIDYTGDTKIGTPSTCQQIEFYGSNSYALYVDDVVVNDNNGTANNSWPGIVRLQPIRPNATGDSAQFTRGGTDRGANWDQVDEAPSVHTDYIYSTTVDQKDLYNAGTFTVPTGATVKNIVVVATALYDSGAGNIAVGLKSTNEDFSTDQAIGATVKTYEYAVPLDPATSAAWGQSAIDAVQIGVKCR